jgi:hypothetical protein
MFRTTFVHSLGMMGLAATLAAPLAWAQESPSVRVRGAIERIDGSIYVVKARDGAELKLTVADKPSIATLVKASLADIKQGSFVGVTAMPQPDGSLSAVEVHIFPEAMRGTGEGHYPWDLRPQSTMTNANVEQVGVTVDGRTLTLKYKDGEKKIFVPADTPSSFMRWGTGQTSSPAPQSSSLPLSSPMERSRVVRGVSAVMARRQPSDWRCLSNSRRALALPATDAAVLGTSALYRRQLHAQQ